MTRHFSYKNFWIPEEVNEPLIFVSYVIAAFELLFLGSYILINKIILPFILPFFLLSQADLQKITFITLLYLLFQKIVPCFFLTLILGLKVFLLVKHTITFRKIAHERTIWNILKLILYGSIGHGIYLLIKNGPYIFSLISTYNLIQRESYLASVYLKIDILRGIGIFCLSPVILYFMIGLIHSWNHASDIIDHSRLFQFLRRLFCRIIVIHTEQNEKSAYTYMLDYPFLFLIILSVLYINRVYIVVIFVIHFIFYSIELTGMNNIVQEQQHTQMLYHKSALHNQKWLLLFTHDSKNSAMGIRSILNDRTKEELTRENLDQLYDYAGQLDSVWNKSSNILQDYSKEYKNETVDLIQTINVVLKYKNDLISLRDVIQKYFNNNDIFVSSNTDALYTIFHEIFLNIVMHSIAPDESYISTFNDTEHVVVYVTDRIDPHMESKINSYISQAELFCSSDKPEINTKDVKTGLIRIMSLYFRLHQDGMFQAYIRTTPFLEKFFIIKFTLPLLHITREEYEEEEDD